MRKEVAVVTDMNKMLKHELICELCESQSGQLPLSVSLRQTTGSDSVGVRTCVEIGPNG